MWKRKTGRSFSPAGIGTLVAILAGPTLFASDRKPGTNLGPPQTPMLTPASLAESSNRAISSVRRISPARVLDSGKVHRLVMNPGMVTLVELPMPMTAVPGLASEELWIQRGEVPTQVFLKLLKYRARASNLIFVSKGRRIVFDIIPSPLIDPRRPSHQDVYEIVDFYQGWDGSQILEEDLIRSKPLPARPDSVGKKTERESPEVRS